MMPDETAQGNAGPQAPTGTPGGVAPAATPPAPARLVSQDRAVYALECVQAVQQRGEPTPRKYRSLVESFPAEVRILGAGQSIALLLSKAAEDAAAATLVEHLRGWLARTGRIPPANGNTALIGGFVGVGRTREQYLAAQEELITITGWLKTFAQALLERE